MDAETLKTIFVEIAAGRSNAAVGRAAGCDRRTVRRYRRLVRALGLPPSEIDALDGEDLRRVFNARLPRHDEPDFAVLAAMFPGSTARFRYERYRERRRALGQAAMSVSQFNRRRAEHDLLEYGAVRFAPPMPKQSTAHLAWGCS
jgi:hypothetical protein